MMEGLGFNRYQEHRETGIDWIEQIPADWKTMKAKFLLTESNSRSVSGDENLLSLSKYHGVIRKDQMSERAGQAESLVGYKEVEAGDLVINKMQASNGLMAVSQVTGITSPDYAIYKAKKNGAARIDYICHVLRQPEYLAEIKRRAKGVMEGFIRLYTDDLFDLPIILPPLQEQQYILDFLDDKCAKIDGAVKIKEDQIALLRERRQILIQDAVTRGLNPAAPMKDSGIDWIGQIPAHWENMPNKYLFRLKKDTVGKRSAEYDLLSLTLRGIIKRDMENPEGKFPAEFDTYQEVCPGDFVFCHFDVEETPRTVGLSEFFGMITGAYTVYSVAQGVDPRFLLHFYIFADTDKKMRSMYKGLRNTIPKDAFAAFKTPLPPIEEQRAIVAHIDDASQKIEDGIAIKERQIAALKEYKTSLINAAVTGKIKVI